MSRGSRNRLCAAQVRGLEKVDWLFVFSAVVGTVVREKALLRGPRLNQRAIHREMLVAHEPLGLLVHCGKELLSYIGSQQPVAILGKHRA